MELVITQKLMKMILKITKDNGVALPIDRIQIAEQIYEYLAHLSHQDYLELREEMITR